MSLLLATFWSSSKVSVLQEDSVIAKKKTVSRLSASFIILGINNLGTSKI